MRRGKEILCEQWEKACTLVRGILSYRIDFTTSVLEKLEALVALTVLIVKSGWKSLIDSLTTFAKELKQNTVYIAEKIKPYINDILQAILNWFKKWRDK